MTLTIGITHYNTDLKVLNKLIDSIDLQQNVDWSKVTVLIVDDHSNERLTDEFLKRDNFKIKYLYLEENGGASKAKNTIIKECNTDYLWMIDSDDILSHVLGLSRILKNINKKYDVIDLLALEETPHEDLTSYDYTPRDRNMFSPQWMFIMSMDFIRTNNLKFESHFGYQDDFIAACLCSYVKNKKFIGYNASYIYSYNEKSITKNGANDFLFNFQKDIIWSCSLLFDYNIDKDIMKSILLNVMRSLIWEFSERDWTAREDKLVELIEVLKERVAFRKKEISELEFDDSDLEINVMIDPLRIPNYEYTNQLWKKVYNGTLDLKFLKEYKENYDSFNLYT